MKCFRCNSWPCGCRDGQTIIVGDSRTVLRELPAGSVNCCVTSPPYWGLRDYGCEGQMGLESTPEKFIDAMVELFAAVRESLSDDGTLWLNLGDSYYGSWQNYGGGARGAGKQRPIVKGSSAQNPVWEGTEGYRPSCTQPHDTLKPKDLVGIPWRVALALQSDGWYLRQDIIWHKPNPMPESVTDRCTKAHEYIFLLSKSERYYYDREAIKEPWTCDRDDMRTKGVRTGLAYLQQGTVASNHAKGRSGNKSRKPASARGVPVDTGGNTNGAVAGSIPWEGTDRNKRSVWTVTTKPYKGAHFATFPPDLIQPCILAGCPAGGVVLDPFLGSGTTAMVASKNGCKSIGVELNPEYAKLAAKRLRQPMLKFTD